MHLSVQNYIWHLRFAFPSKKSSLQKIFGSDLTLHAREARGTPLDHWFSLSAIKENQSNSDLSSNLMTLYDVARTYFSNNPE